MQQTYVLRNKSDREEKMMETKLFDKNLITLDGRMDEQVWNSVKEYTGFKMKKSRGGQIAQVQTSFKILPCEDRIYIGIRCEEPDMAYVNKVNPQLAIWTCDDVEIFLSPNNNPFDFYQFAITFEGQTAQLFYSENGNIKPDPYAPEWKKAVYKGEDFWSVEVELPLTAFYMTSQAAWSDTWLVNISRMRTYRKDNAHNRTVSYWSDIENKSLESKNFWPVEGFPMRPAEDAVCITNAAVEITEETEKGYCGTLTVRTTNPENGEFVFSSEYADTVTVKLTEGANEFAVPCCFDACKRYRAPLELKRLSDGKVFKRYYPVRIAYEAIKLEFTQPEFRTNFYPGQDYSKVVGKVTCAKPVTLKLEGAGLDTQVVTPDAEGNFTFDTSKMEEGEALLTAATADKEVTRKIRRLAPSGHMTAWISDGKMIVDGEPVFARTVSAVGWKGGEAFKRKYEADNLHETRQIREEEGWVQPDRILKGLGLPVSETTKDEMPREEVFRKIDEVIEANRDRDFTFYYLCDEPECRAVSPIYLKHIYDYIADKDPYHLIRVPSRESSRYLEAGDFFETHPYINPYTDENGKRIYGRQLSDIGKYVDDIAKLNKPDKSIGFYGTCYAAMKGRKDPYPTFDEYICNSWVGIVRGAKTLRQYAYHDLNDRAQMYEGTRYVFSSVEALEELILHGKRTTLQKSQETECCLFEYKGEKMFVLVNFTQEPQTITRNELTGTWHHFRHNETITGPTYEMKPVEVIIGTSKVMDAGMPTYQETAQLIDKLEYERTHSGNLLFERQKDVILTTSGTKDWYSKIFDGIRDNYAWSQVSDGDKFYEVDISKIKPAFNKVVISGYHIDDMELKVRNGDELTVPAIAEVQAEEFSTTFILKETITPDALRLEFHQRQVELYEIEVFKV